VKKEYQDYRRRMDNYKMNENVKKGKELLRGFGGKAWELGMYVTHMNESCHTYE